MGGTGYTGCPRVGRNRTRPTPAACQPASQPARAGRSNHTSHSSQSDNQQARKGESILQQTSQPASQQASRQATSAQCATSTWVARWARGWGGWLVLNETHARCVIYTTLGGRLISRLTKHARSDRNLPGSKYGSEYSWNGVNRMVKYARSIIHGSDNE